MNRLFIVSVLLLAGCEARVCVEDNGNSKSVYTMPAGYRHIGDDISITNGIATVTVWFKKK